MKKLTLLFFLVIIVFSACKKKYPDDKHNHLNSPQKRLSRTSWVIDNYEFLTSYTYQFSSFRNDDYISFIKNGTCNGGGSIPGQMLYLWNFNGTWEFIENDNKIKITYKTNPGYSKIWTILELDRSQLVISCDSVKYTLVPRRSS
jgi:hypothetical protein